MTGRLRKGVRVYAHGPQEASADATSGRSARFLGQVEDTAKRAMPAGSPITFRKDFRQEVLSMEVSIRACERRCGHSQRCGLQDKRDTEL